VDDKELGIEHRYIDLGEVYLHYVEAGSGPLVVLLHGFPEFWYSWRYQIPALAKAGFRVVAPDMRGYNISGKPRGVKAYHIDKLTGDVAKLIEKLGAEKAVVVGHDWGAMVAWVFAMQYPQLLERLVILNVPHPVRLEKGLRTPQQLLKSWYTFFFQIPFLPEFFSRLFDYQVFRQTFKRDPVRPGAFTSEDVEKYVQAIAQPGALTAGINYYRAIMRAQLIWKDRPPYHKIKAPVLVIWGDQDRYLGKELAEPSAEWVPGAEVRHLRDASHWVQLDCPEQVNELIINFLSR
jgi:pimeloyl-ACP methyl ester carboxylesterase